MVNFKKNSSRFWHSPIVLFLLFCILCLFAYNLFGLIKKERETAHNKAIVLKRIEDLKKRESSLSADIKKMETLEGKEEIIRDKYQVAKSGEKMITIIDEDIQNNKEDQLKEKTGLWNWIKGIFKK